MPCWVIRKASVEAWMDRLDGGFQRSQVSPFSSCLCRCFLLILVPKPRINRLIFLEIKPRALTFAPQNQWIRTEPTATTNPRFSTQCCLSPTLRFPPPFHPPAVLLEFAKALDLTTCRFRLRKYDGMAWDVAGIPET